MKRTHMLSMFAALACAAFFGIAGSADAQGGMNPEQYKAMQDSFSEFDKKIQPLRQQLFAKQAELDALYAGGSAPDEARAQALMKEIDGLDVKMQEARLEMRKQMVGRGIPFHGGRMGPGYGGGYGPGCGGSGWRGGYGPGCGGPGYGGGYGPGCGGPGWRGGCDGPGYGRGWHGGRHGWRGGCN